MKFIWLDTETTTTDVKTGEIIQLGFVFINGDKIIDKGILYGRPTNVDVISPEWYDKIKLTNEEILAYPERKLMYEEFLNRLDKFIGRFDKQDKAIFSGYNTQFDLNFLCTMFSNEFNNPYLFSYIHKLQNDVMHMVYQYSLANCIILPDYKLETVCKHFGIEIQNAHNALHDIVATIKLFRVLNPKFTVTM